MAGNRRDPYSAFNFIVEFDGIAVAAFSEVSGLSFEIEPIEYRDGSDAVPTVRKLPGLVKYANVTLKRGITGDRGFWEWIIQTTSGEVERRTGSIVILNESRQPAARYLIKEAWPCRYAGPELSAGSSEVAIESIEICHEGLELVD